MQEALFYEFNIERHVPADPPAPLDRAADRLRAAVTLGATARIAWLAAGSRGRRCVRFLRMLPMPCCRT